MSTDLQSGRAQLLLPFAEKEYIDIGRACRIYGVTWMVVRQMAEEGIIT